MQLRAFLFNNIRTDFVILSFSNPHILEGTQRRKNRGSDPSAELSFNRERRSSDFHFGVLYKP